MSAQCKTKIPARVTMAIVVATTFAAFATIGHAEAKTYVVKNTADHGKGSLKKAINHSDDNRGRDTIRFKRSLAGEIAIRKSQKITDPVRMIGNGDDDLTLEGVLSGSRLDFTTNKKKRSRLAQLNLLRVSVRAVGKGGNRGGLQVIDTTLAGDNSASGAGISAQRAALKVTGSRISGFLGDGINAGYSPVEVAETTAAGNGGTGLYVSGTDAVVERTTLSDNRHWGALASYGTLIALTNSTVSGNGDPTDAESGGINAQHGSFKVESTTIADNRFAEAGYGIAGAAMQGSRGGTITLTNSVIADNHGHNCSATASYVSDGGNVYDEAGGCDGLTPKDALADPLLGPLADNGGPTETHALGAGSPAIGKAVAGGPDVDQRGVGRDGDPDSGAFELTG